MAKFHKIGTNITSYIEEIRLYDVASKFIPAGEWKEGTTSKQKLEILVTLNLLESFNDTYYESKSDLYYGSYIVKPSSDKDIINNLNKAFDSVIEYELFDDNVVTPKDFFKYINEIDNIKSFAGSLIYFEYDKELAKRYFEGNIADREFKYFYIPSLSSKELIEKALKIISPTTLYNHGDHDDNDEAKKRKLLIQDNIDVLTLDESDSIEITSKVFRYNQLLKFFISDREFKVPIYQRDYVWSKVSIENLFNSILNDERATNIGAIVFHKRESAMFKELYTIIDGQQRVTSLFIMLRALYMVSFSISNVLEKKYIETGNKEFLTEKKLIDSLFYNIEDKYFKIKEDSNTIIGNSFSRINGDDSYQAFSDLLNLTEKRKSTNNQIDKNLSEIKNCLEKLFKTNGVNGIITFATKLLNNVFVTVNIDKLTDELHLFEILNTTSIELSTLDLMKSYYIGLLKDEEIEIHENEIQALFYEKIMNKISINKLSIDDFIRIVLRYKLQYDKVYRTLFDNFKDKNSQQCASCDFGEIKALIIDLEEYLDIYMYIKKVGEKSRFRNFKLDDFLDTLNRDIYYPVIIHFIKLIEAEKLTYNVARQCLFEIERFEIIFQICNYRGQSLSVQMDNVLKEIKEHDDKIDKVKVANIMNKINIFKISLNISKTNFENRIMELDFSQQLAAKVLSRIVHYKKNNQKITIMDTDYIDILDQVSAEHIFPKDPSKWNKQRSEYVDYYQKIGNYAVINKKDNSKLSNKPFETKMKHLKQLTYLSNDLTLNDNRYKGGFEVLSLSSWDKEDITKRSKFLSKLCIEIWIEQ